MAKISNPLIVSFSTYPHSQSSALWIANPFGYPAVVVVFVVVFDASAPKVSDSQHPFKVVSKDREVWKRTSKDVLSSCVKPVFNCLWLLFAKGTQGVCGGFEEMCVGLQQWCVAESEAREEDRIRSVGSGSAVLGPIEPAIHLRGPWICRWWIYKCPADEGSRGCIRNGPKSVAGG